MSTHPRNLNINNLADRAHLIALGLAHVLTPANPAKWGAVITAHRTAELALAQLANLSRTQRSGRNYGGGKRKIVLRTDIEIVEVTA